MRGAATDRLLDAARGAGAMTAVIAVMLFLTALAAAMALATWRATAALERGVARRVTVQLVGGDPVRRAREGAALARRLARVPGVTRVDPVPPAELARLLRPFIGDGDAAGIPLPVMIDVAMETEAVQPRVADAARGVAPDARIDAHAAWMTPVSRALSLATSLGAALVLLTAGATAAVVVLAARAGLDAHRATIEVVHMLGASDAQVARLFQRRIAYDAATGGAAGTAAAAAVIALAGAELAAIGGGLTGEASLGAGGWLTIALLPVAFVGIATLAARLAVTRALARLL